MTNEERGLLLATARVLRARVRGDTYAEKADDLEAMNDALRPFDPLPGNVVNEQSQG